MRRIYLLTLLLCMITGLTAKDFTVVIDAGHGGKDPGALSANKNIREKDINLKVALMVGENIKKRHPEVNILYTRDKDIFVGLNDRARIANQANADLFISIHCNAAANRSAKGAETFTLGVEEERTERNLDIAKRENGVIFLEDNHEKKYSNFNPNSPESYIIFEYMQSEFVKESIHIAQYVQENLTVSANLRDRGVRQAGFLVLNATSMPSILVELGYISNTEEAKYLASAAGQKKLSECISSAFDKYYADLTKQMENTPMEYMAHKKTEGNANIEENPSVDISDKPVFKIQFLTSSTKLKDNDKAFKGLTDVECYQEKGLYKYTHGATSDYNQILRTKKKVNEIFKDAFIVAFINGKRVNTQEAIALYKENNP